MNLHVKITIVVLQYFIYSFIVFFKIIFKLVKNFIKMFYFSLAAILLPEQIPYLPDLAVHFFRNAKYSFLMQNWLPLLSLCPPSASTNFLDMKIIYFSSISIRAITFYPNLNSNYKRVRIAVCLSNIILGLIWLCFTGVIDYFQFFMLL